MTNYVGEWCARNRPPGCSSPPSKANGKRRNRTKLKLPWRWLVTPPSGGIYGLHTAVAFEVFRYLCETGSTYRSRDASGWGDSGPNEVLSCGSGVGSSSVDGFADKNFIADLRKRFLHALFETPRAKATADWRDAIKLDVNETVEIPVRHYSPQFTAHPLASATFEYAVGRLLNVVGCQLQHSWNQYHRDAIWVCGNTLACETTTKASQTGWSYFLNYDYKNDSSTWQVLVAKQEKRENFHDFIVRCNLIVDTLAYDPPAAPKPTWDKVDFKEIHDAGYAGPLEALQFSLEHQRPPRPVARQKRRFVFKAELSRREHQRGWATVSVTAKSEKDAKEILNNCGPYDSVDVECKRPEIDVVSAKRIRKPKQAAKAK